MRKGMVSVKKHARNNLTVVEHQPDVLSPEVLEKKRQAIIARAVEAADEVLEALLEEARTGNVQAAKVLLQVAGLLHGGGPVATARVNLSEIQISPEELAELEKSLREWERR